MFFLRNEHIVEEVFAGVARKHLRVGEVCWGWTVACTGRIPESSKSIGASAKVFRVLNRSGRAVRRLGLFPMLLVASMATAAAGQADGGSAARIRIEAAIANISQLTRPDEDGVATIWDGNKFVQCRHMQDDTLRCEAAGTLMQPTLANVLTPERAVALVGAGWRLDPSFGNYVHTFQAARPAPEIADELMAALEIGYDVDPARIEVGTSWIAREDCPPRAGPSQNLAGSINNSPRMEAVAVTGCSYVASSPVPAAEASAAPQPDDAQPLTLEELLDWAGAPVAAEIGRLRVNARRRVFAVFKSGVGYVQCAPETDPVAIYCEAQSADEWPALATVLTPSHVARLHDLGFTDPGRAPNYWQVYDADSNSDEDIARNVLTTLFDVYGYRGTTDLVLQTEK